MRAIPIVGDVLLCCTDRKNVQLSLVTLQFEIWVLIRCTQHSLLMGTCEEVKITFTWAFLRYSSIYFTVTDTLFIYTLKMGHDVKLYRTLAPSNSLYQFVDLKLKLFAFRYQKRVYNIIDDVLEWSPSLALSGMMEKQQTVVNTTDPNNNFTDGTKESTEKVVHPNDMDEEIFSEQQVDEDDIRNVEDAESPSTSQ